MNELCDTLLQEYRDLADLCASLSAEQWQRPTDFYGWSAWDEVAHLAFFDQWALLSIEDPAAFARHKAEFAQATREGREISVLAREALGHLDGAALLAHWRDRFETLVKALRAFEPRARLGWYGPDMSARSFATARLMECWAHGQDIWDGLGRVRGASAGLKHIAHLGVSTYGWTFVNRGLTPPAPAPALTLTAPDGELWHWGEASDTDWVRGPALDFALLVTQRRNRADTALQWAGEGAEQWLAIAQCFAGDPADGPGPGERVGQARF